MEQNRRLRRTERVAVLAWLAAGGVLAGCLTHVTAAKDMEPTPANVPQPGQTHARVEVLLPRGVVPGSTMDVGVRFTIEKDWHLYWNGQNDSGTPIVLDLKMPAGFKAKETLWPAPERLVEPGGILNHVYEREVVLIVPVEVAKDAKIGQAEVSVDARWLACKSACVPESGGAKASVSVNAVPGDQSAIYIHEAVAEARAALPIELAQGDPRVRTTIAGQQVKILAPGAKEIAFMPGPNCAPVKSLAEKGIVQGEHLVFEVEDGLNNIRISGIVRVTNPEGLRAYYHIDTHAGARPAEEQDRPVPGH